MRDVSRILSDSEFIKLRELIKQSGPMSMEPLGAHAFEEYPKMLFAPGWLMVFRLTKEHPDPLVKKEAREKLKHVQIIVDDIETEEEYLLDHWKRDPNDFVIEDNLAHGMANPDPRVPVGREGRRAKAQQKLSIEQEISELRRRYAELTQTSILDLPAARVAAPAPVDDDGMELSGGLESPAPAPVPRSVRPASAAVGGQAKRDRVAQGARRSAEART